jgi:hypothetical protein
MILKEVKQWFTKAEKHLINTAYLYLNAPLIVGGKHLGIDCSGFTQMVYKSNGYKLMRMLLNKQLRREPLSFIEESDQVT